MKEKGRSKISGYSIFLAVAPVFSVGMAAVKGETWVFFLWMFIFSFAGFFVSMVKPETALMGRSVSRPVATVVYGSIALVFLLAAGAASGGFDRERGKPGVGSRAMAQPVEDNSVAVIAQGPAKEMSNGSGSIHITNINKMHNLYKVSYIFDGDTIEVMIKDSRERVRLIGIDAPEMGRRSGEKEYCAEEATKLLAELLGGKGIRLEIGEEKRDRYRRLLAYVYVDAGNGAEVFVNAEMVKQGLARAKSYPPNVRQDDVLFKSQWLAQESGLGIWGTAACAPVESSK